MSKQAIWEREEPVSRTDILEDPSKRQGEQRELMGRDVSLPEAILDPLRPHIKGIDVAESVTGGDTERTIEGASTITLDVHDPDGDILASGLLDVDDEDELARIGLRVDRLDFILVSVSKQGYDLTLTFEDRDVNDARHGRGRPLKARRGKTTRAEFILRTLKDVIKKRKVRFHSPELHKEQPVKPLRRGHRQKDRNERDGRRETGLDRSARLSIPEPGTGRNVRATNEQLSNGERILRQVEEDGGDEVVMVAAIAAAMDETRVRDVEGGDRDSTGILQLRVGFFGAAVASSIEKSVHLFVTKKGGFTGGSPGNAKDLAHKGWNAARIAGSIMNNVGESMYGPFVAAAREWVSAYSGGGLAGGSRTKLVVKPYEFRRERNEDSWEAGQRLALEVGWRLFVVSGVFYYMSEEDLFKSRVRFRFSPKDDAIDDVSFDWDKGRKVSEVTVSCRIHRWAAPPGSVVYIDEGGPVTGRWLVTSVRRPVFSAAGEITLRKPIKERLEPSPETEEKTVGSGGQGGQRSGRRGGATGDLDWPVRGPVTSGFGARSSPGGIGSTYHDGIDIGVSYTAVHAADGGTVVVAGWNGGYGNYVEIDHHNGLHTFYGHLSKISVHRGERVSKGEVIATSGNTGSSTGPHLHFGVHQNGAPVDPMRFL